MALPTLSGTARLTADPELRFTPSGMAVCTVQLAFNSRKKDQQTGEWTDGDTFFIRGTAFKELAENIAETLTKGTEVVVTGRLKTERYETREGEKRSSTAMMLDSIGPSLRYATAKVAKATRTTGGGYGAPADDPWSSAPAAGTGNAGYDDEPPF